MHTDYTSAFLHEKVAFQEYCPAFLSFLLTGRPLITIVQEHHFGALQCILGKFFIPLSPFPAMVLAHMAAVHPLLVQSNTDFPLLFLTSFHLLCLFACLLQSQSLQLILLSREKEHEEGKWTDQAWRTFFSSSFTQPAASIYHQFSFISILLAILLCSLSRLLLLLSQGGRLIWVFLAGQIEVSLLPSESESLPPLTVPDFKSIATPPLVSR